MSIRVIYWVRNPNSCEVIAMNKKLRRTWTKLGAAGLLLASATLSELASRLFSKGTWMAMSVADEPQRPVKVDWEQALDKHGPAYAEAVKELAQAMARGAKVN